jgi:hypothetical protein
MFLSPMVEIPRWMPACAGMTNFYYGQRPSYRWKTVSRLRGWTPVFTGVTISAGMTEIGGDFGVDEFRTPHLGD